MDRGHCDRADRLRAVAERVKVLVGFQGRLGYETLTAFSDAGRRLRSTMRRLAQRGFIQLGLLGYGLLALGILGMLGGIVYKIREGGYDKAKAECLEAAEAQRQIEVQASAKAAKELAEARAKIKVIIQERVVHVDRIVQNPVYLNTCLDDAGLQCLRSAIRGEGASGCKPDRALPKPAPPDRDNGKRSTALDDRVG